MTEQKLTEVAVIGAGVSGVCVAAHLLKLGIKVILFERGSAVGGVWHFDELVAPEPDYPSILPSRGDYTIVSPTTREQSRQHILSQDVKIAHAPPGPCYAGLKNNVSTRLMKTTLAAWDQGTEDFVSHERIEGYIRTISIVNDVEDVIRYNTRVDQVRKHGERWSIATTELLVQNEEMLLDFKKETWAFDAVVVASGHYNAPRIPEVPGLADWKKTWPDSMHHSKAYRSSERFRDKTVMLVGAGVSSNDIAREISTVARKVYQSSRGGLYDLPESYLPAEVSRVGAIASFNIQYVDTTDKSYEQSMSGEVLLENGTKLCDIDNVILCTGYMTSYPFLPQFHEDTTPAFLADEDVLVTSEGEMLHNCYKDTFYIPDPTLAFVGTPFHVATFSCFEFQAIAAARVFAGQATLPCRSIMKEEYRQKLTRKGLGREFHSLRGPGEEENFVSDLVDWLNCDARRLRLKEVSGHTEQWYVAHTERRAKLVEYVAEVALKKRRRQEHNCDLTSRRSIDIVVSL